MKTPLDFIPHRESPRPDVKLVKTGISPASPPVFLTQPLFLKKSKQKKDPLALFFHGAKWKPKALSFGDDSTDNFPDEASDEPRLKLVAIRQEEGSPVDPETYLRLSTQLEEPKPEEPELIVEEPVQVEIPEKEILPVEVDLPPPPPPPEPPITNEIKSLLGSLLNELVNLKENSKKAPVAPQPQIILPPAFWERLMNKDVSAPIQDPLSLEPQAILPKKQPKRQSKKSSVKKINLSQRLLKELNDAMKKMSIAGLFLGLLILGVLFFFIGFLASYSSWKDQKPECPEPPTPPIFSDTIIEEKSKPAARGTEKKVDLEALAKDEAREKVKGMLPNKGVLGGVAGAVLGGKDPGGMTTADKGAVKPISEAAVRIASRRLTQDSKAVQQDIINHLPPGMRPFAEQARQLHQPGKVSLTPQASALQGPFVRNRYGTTPPPSQRDSRHFERGFGRGTLQDAYRQRFGGTPGIRPHVPRPVFAPPLGKGGIEVPSEAVYGYDAYGNPMPPPVLMPIVPIPNQRGAVYSMNGSPMGAPMQQVPPIQPVQQMQGGIQPHYMAPPAPNQQPQYAPQIVPQGAPQFGEQTGHPGGYSGIYHGAPQPYPNQQHQQPPTRLIGMG